MIREKLAGHGHLQAGSAIVPDDPQRITAELSRAQAAGAQVALVTGGTGLSRRDSTFEALSAAIVCGPLPGGKPRAGAAQGGPPSGEGAPGRSENDAPAGARDSIITREVLAFMKTRSVSSCSCGQDPGRAGQLPDHGGLQNHG
ncbi:MAG: hypothetical protein E6J61_01140 [Deltaproteobacteria bacterium]|nr:MAG: hypothetical protein E6J61_01140 [Deltaproteobacteria bacterium]